MWSTTSVLVLLMLCAGARAGRAPAAEEDAETTTLEPEDAGVPTPPPSPALCPTSSTHLLCDAARCLRYEEERPGPDSGDACSMRCAEPAPTCLHRKYVCDGVPDCEDAADEADCLQCSLDAFPCDGVCRRRELLCDKAYSHCRPAGTICSGRPLACGAGANLTCDGVDDCGGRDELSCGSPLDCQPGAFYCDGRCHRASRRCDGVRHCQDGADERGCPASLHEVAVVYKHAEGTVTRRECFDCGNGRCVPPAVKCDGVDDCGNKKDEKRCFAPICAAGGGRNCVATKCSEQGIPCSSGYRCGRLKWACDGHAQCEAGADEPADCQAPPRVFFCRGDSDDAEPRPAAAWCDGRADCPGGQDEADCPSEPPLARVYCADNRTGHGHAQGGRAVACAPLPRLIRCHDGSPRLETTRCDGVADCPDAEDEASCSQCYDGAVLCDGRCVMASRRCDGFFDCSDGADERGCHDDLVLGSAFFHPRVCGPGRFDCGSRCIDSQFVCDGVPDCENHADEVNCRACRGGSTPCSGRCVLRLAACPGEAACAAGAGAGAGGGVATPGTCDGVPQCASGQDEAGCASEEACLAGVFCDGACRPRSARCDGRRDCGDGRDELGCPEGWPTRRPGSRGGASTTASSSPGPTAACSPSPAPPPT